MPSPPFIHEKAICECKNIGNDTRIWAYTHILADAVIGSHCNICDYVFIENQVIIGNNVTIKCGVQLWDNIQIDDEVFIGPNVTFTNDHFPRSKKHPTQFLKTHVKKGASIGANATILPGITIGEKAMVGAGSVITKNVPPYAIVAGNPAKIMGYENTYHSKEIDSQLAMGSNKNNNEQTVTRLPIKNCSLHALPTFDDLRGNLMVNEFQHIMPFIPRRTFFVYGIPSNRVRGEHAHKQCDQFLIALQGSLEVALDDATNRMEVTLSSPAMGLYIPACTWGIQYKFTSDAILCVFASHDYEADDYIREYSDFISYVKSKT